MLSGVASHGGICARSSAAACVVTVGFCVRSLAAVLDTSTGGTDGGLPLGHNSDPVPTAIATHTTLTMKCVNNLGLLAPRPRERSDFRVRSVERLLLWGTCQRETRVVGPPVTKLGPL